MAKTEIKTIERTYTIPLRKEFNKTPRWKKTKKAVSAVKQFLMKHMKSEDIKLGRALNENLWKHGIRNPPHKIKVSVTRDDKGTVRAELFGVKAEETKKETKKKVENKKAEKAEAATEESRTKPAVLEPEKPELKKELPKEKAAPKTSKSN